MSSYPPESGIPGEPPGPYSADDHLEELNGALEAQLVYPTPDWCEAQAVGMPHYCCGAPGHCLDPQPEQVLEDLATLDRSLLAEVLNGLMKREDG